MNSPRTRLTQISPPAKEPLDVESAQLFLRTSFDADQIAELIVAAREDLEHRTQTSFITQRWELALDFLPGMPFGPWAWPYSREIELPRSPLISVESITYRDQSGNQTVLAPSSYVVSTGRPGRIAPTCGTSFPFCYPQLSGVSIKYTCGFGPEPSDVPRSIVQALRHLVGFMYDSRSEDAVEPSVINRLLNRTRWMTYA